MRGGPGIHCSHMHGSPGFSGEHGNYCDTSPCFTTAHYWIMGVITSRSSSVRSTKLYRMPSVRLESQEWHWRTNNSNTARLYSKHVFVWLPTDTAARQVYTYELLPFVFVPRIHFGKAEEAYRYPELASYGSAWCSYSLESYILPNISPCYYLQIQLTYLNELYGEWTARACVNSGYQVLLSYFSSAWERD